MKDNELFEKVKELEVELREEVKKNGNSKRASFSIKKCTNSYMEICAL